MKKPKKDKKSFDLSDDSESIKTFANKQEKRIAKKIKGKQTINSGAMFFMPGDIYVGENLIDVKSAKMSKQIVVTEYMLIKLERDASVKRKNPVIILNFPKASDELKNKQWVLIPMKGDIL